MSNGLREIEALAWSTLREYGLVSQGWTFKWDGAKRRSGLCNHTRQTISLSRATFSIPENQHIARNTILHEVAHALVGPGHGHGHVWKRQARAIGCTGDRCTELAVAPRGKYTGTCGCGDIHQMSRLSRNRRGEIASYSCNLCGKHILWRVN